MTFYVFCYVFLFSQVNASRGTKVGHIDQEFTKSVFGVKLPEPFKQAKTQWSRTWKRFDLIIIGNTQVNQLNHNQHASCKVQTLQFDLNVENSVFS